ncbi:MAG TPA: tripartite tricarboxylate transporter substrate binding protein [Casimicrobiaceae bacterium]|nr:tripartite tricarboxylate transporter substrate binding protein [Casimicrobiaceae bacterium]
MRQLVRRGWMALVVTALALPLGAYAQDYPKGNVRIIVPYPAGGYTDLLARQLAAGLQSRLGHSFIVENKPGAATAIAAEYVVAAPPDGQTLMMTTVTTLALNPLTIKDLRYKPEQFVPVALVARQPFMLVASLTFPPNNPTELIAYAKANPGKINWATQGLAGSSQLVGELLKSLAGIDMTAIHYKGSAPANIDIMGGRVDVHFDGVGTSLPNVAARKVKAIAVTSDKRMAVAPDIPTFVEYGLPGMVAYSWYGIVAPPGTPPAIVNKLNQEIVRWAHEKPVQEQMARDGSEGNAMTPAEFGKMIADETEMWRKIIAPMNLKME